MGVCADRLRREFESQWELLRQADGIVLYGKNDVSPVMEIALRELGAAAAPSIFDAGHFADGSSAAPQSTAAVILCGMQTKTRMAMKKDAAAFFPSAPCFDYLAIYYQWLCTCVRRDCDRETLAQTLLAGRAGQAIQNIDSINGSYCNLNCKECSNGMQVRRNKKWVEIGRHIRSLENLTKVKPIAYCNLQGGEPFLDRDFARRIELHAANPRIAFLTVAANGTLVPGDDVMAAMRKAGAMLRISDYGAVSSKKQELAQKAAQFAVPCDVYHRSETWVAYGPLQAHGRVAAENQAALGSCHFGTKDLMLYDGTLYSCCRALFADALGVSNAATEANALNVLEPFTPEQLESIVEGKKLYRMCDYCDWPMQVVPAGEQAPRSVLADRANACAQN